MSDWWNYILLCSSSCHGTPPSFHSTAESETECSWHLATNTFCNLVAWEHVPFALGRQSPAADHEIGRKRQRSLFALKRIITTHITLRDTFNLGCLIAWLSLSYYVTSLICAWSVLLLCGSNLAKEESFCITNGTWHFGTFSATKENSRALHEDNVWHCSR